MILTDRILKNDEYGKCMTMIENAEETRVFCRHGMDHNLDVARIAYILAKEESMDLSKDLIYAAALLHDIGRRKEYTDGTPHHEAGVIIARRILNECGATAEEISLICHAIEHHRGHDVGDATTVEGGTVAERPQQLSIILKKADKLSRPCYRCEASADCKWPDDKKNHSITF